MRSAREIRSQEAECFKRGKTQCNEVYGNVCSRADKFEDNSEMNGFLRFLVYWVSTALALWIVDGVFDSLQFDSVQTLLLSALVLALVNLTIKPVLLLVTLPLTIFTLGLAIPLINGAMLLLVSEIVPGFTIAGFWSGVLCALAISFVSLLINLATGQSVVRARRQPD